jgi:hypothetical protein
MSALQRERVVPFQQVEIDDAFWAPRLETNRKVTLPIQYQHLKSTGRIDAWSWEPGQPNEPHIFWDSDVAKWIEAAAYSLANHPDPELERRIDEVVRAMEEAQWEDGYLNSHYSTVEPEKRWTNLRDCHELYCAGHLMEAAVAYVRATGKDRLLKVMQRYADHIDRLYGPGDDQLQGYPGHEEIELALVKLYRETGEARYLQLAKFFVDERGRQPYYFDLEAEARGEDPASYRFGDYAYTQAHVPLREQREVTGHAVRAGYLYAGAADVAAETGDESLVEPLERLWNSVTRRRMYVTGGVGPTAANEGFTVDYDLPNETAYAETCAAIALVFWARRMLHLRPQGRYADVMERALYNGVLSGVSLSGDRFFYANPLAAYPRMGRFAPRNIHSRRQDWFGCACCPPNLARLLASLGSYVYGQGEDAIWVHLYVGSSTKLELSGQTIWLETETDYPWDGRVQITLRPEQEVELSLNLRVPGWCRGAKVAVNGEPLDLDEVTTDGYARIRRRWGPGDEVELAIEMPVERMEAHPSVRQDAGRVALQRGPLVYCLEEVDNGPDLRDLVLPRESELEVTREPEQFDGGACLRGTALRRSREPWRDELYRPGPTEREEQTIRAIPYAYWANRAEGEMLVWIGQC